jgi:hypothetical protein
MKTKLSLFLLILALSPVPFALSQIPQGFNYQAIARDGSGNILPNTPLQAMMYVQSLSTGGTLFWKELHSTITTNSFGLFTLVVGTGTRQTESTVATFDLIDWSVTPKYLKTEIYYSGSWKDMGTSQLMSVPYAMTAGDLAGTVDKLAVKGTTSGLEDALFEVKNRDGQTVFAVYNEGVRVYVSDGAKAVKGGFAVGGFGTDKAESTKYLFVGKDSVRIYLDTNPLTKKLKGGFAVGGYDLTKGTLIEDYLQVTRDSTRIYVNEGSGKAQKGGFAVGGFDITKGTQTITPFTSLKPENYFIGHESGLKIMPVVARYNAVLGYQAGKELTGGSYNTFIGYRAGMMNTVGYMNEFLGYEAGTNNLNGNWNTFIGMQSGQDNTSGSGNIFIGSGSGKRNTTGFGNINIGSSAGSSSIASDGNVNIGPEAGFFNIEGSNNVKVGWQAGRSSLTSDNVYVGRGSGYSNQNGQHNMVIGSFAGYNMEGSNNTYIGYNTARQVVGSNNTFLGCESHPNNPISGCVFLGYKSGEEINENDRLIITNAAYNTLIYGQFDNRRVGIATTTPGTYTLYVNGTAYSTGGWTGSDFRWKKDIKPFENVIQGILQLQGVTFNWNKEQFPEMNFENGTQAGLIAQDVEKFFPLLVRTNSDGYKAVAYDKLSVVLVEAIKEQQYQIESYKSENDNLKSQLQKLQEKVDRIETLLLKTLDE